MFKKTLIFSRYIVIISILMIILPPSGYAGSGDNFYFINYIGHSMYLTLNDQEYVIQGTDAMPDGGILTLDLPLGEYRYTVHIPGVPIGNGGEFTLDGSNRFIKGARIEKTAPKTENGILIEKPKDYVYLFEADPFATPTEPLPIVDTWQPNLPTMGQASLVWVNYWGNDELTLDLNGQVYNVPPQTDTIPGRLQLDLSPGLYRYSVSIPKGATNGEIELGNGQIIGLNIAIQRDPIEYDVGDDFEPLPPATVQVITEDLTAQSYLTAEILPALDGAPSFLPVTGELFSTDETITIAKGLTVVNFTAETLLYDY
ncbi:hypothetical protein QUF58_02145 [Anaerolineales bacterium HSG24]|nr:hypothetical protein [Anaerolineales bacterium HSG24]